MLSLYPLLIARAATAKKVGHTSQRFSSGCHCRRRTPATSQLGGMNRGPYSRIFMNSGASKLKGQSCFRLQLWSFQSDPLQAPGCCRLAHLTGGGHVVDFLRTCTYLQHCTIRIHVGHVPELAPEASDYARMVQLSSHH